MKKVMMSVAILFILGILGMGTAITKDGFTEATNSKSVHINQEKTFQANDVSAIQITNDVGKVTIKQSKDESIHAHLYGNFPEKERMNLHGYVKDGKLTILTKKQTSPFNMISFPTSVNGHLKGKKLDIYLPKKALNSLSITTDVGQILVKEKIHSNHLKLVSDVGYISVKNYEGKTLIAKSDMGKVDILNSTADITVETDTGEINVHTPEVDHNITMKTDMGEVNLLVDKKIDNALLHGKTDMGNIDFSVSKGEEVHKSENEKKIKIGNGEYKVTAITDAGSITIKN